MNEFDRLGVMSLDELKCFLLDNKKAVGDLAFDIYRICNRERENEQEIKFLRKELKSIRKEKRENMREMKQLLDDTHEVEEKILCVEKAIGAKPSSGNAAEATTETNH